MSKIILKLCKKCNSSTEHYVSSGSCKKCSEERRVARRESDIDSARERSRKISADWRAANPEKAKKVRSDFYARNAEKIKAKAAEVRRLDPEKFRLRNIVRYAANPEIHKGYVAKWKKKNKEVCRAHDHNKRARKKENGGRLSKDIVEKLMKLQRGKCACCFLKLENDFHIDHIIPTAIGGKNTDNNVQLLHSSCNLKKHAKHPIDFMQQRGLLL